MLLDAVREEEAFAVAQFEYIGYASHVVFGVGASEGPEFAAAIDALGARRILLVATEAERELAERIAAVAGERVVGSFSDVRPHVPIEVAQAARATAAACRADALLCVGGGSTTGTAKAIALESGAPIIAVPTTYAGSEVTPVWGLTENARKRTGIDQRVLPRLVVYDPALTMSLPLTLSVASGLNAMAHCAEALWAAKRNPISSLIAEEGIRALAGGLADLSVDPHDLDARSQLLYGAWLAGTTFASVGSGLHHKICHALGGAYDLPHAETHAVVLPYATAMAVADVDGVDARLAAALGAPGEPAAQAIFALERRLGAPASLAALGLAEDQLEPATELVFEALSVLPHPLEHGAVEALLRAAFDGASPLSLLSLR